MIETIAGSVEDAKKHLMRQALKRFPIGMMIPCGRGPDLESGFVFEPSLSIVTFWYNIKDKGTMTEAIRLERRQYDYDAHIPERRKV